MGGSGSASEVVATIAKNENVPESVQQEKLKSGGLRFNNQIHFARQYLVWAGLLASSQRGLWTLTEKGTSTSLSHGDALKIFKEQHSLHQKKKEIIDDLKINPFVSFRVAFQCKRYDQAVVSSAISTFRGSIPSSVDKGIMITTGYFTSDAKSLAQNPGLKPIELIDGDQLIELMEKMELGLKPTFIVDEEFFEGF